jgi:hypothetical protein
MNAYLKEVARSMLMFGVDLRRLLALRNVPKYIAQRRRFKSLGGNIDKSYPVLIDFDEQAGEGRGHYFHQDLLVASFIAQRNPLRHIDIGSRIDGFVAHVASFRRIDVIDVRDLKCLGHKNISFLRSDLMVDNVNMHGVTDSVSCLHAIEHFGLGRYGDPIDPNGHVKGYNNILKMLKPDGTLYISMPIGTKDVVFFNAHRVFRPNDIFAWSNSDVKVELLRFDLIDDDGNLHQGVSPDSVGEDLKYGCGVYTMRKCK